ncbi:thioesterase II family protein [Streptomyces sennicomposti]|uniref:thioesterase II family protein n=1 Tax=Streptomyces sennicomposti TaxID=2873384 RepID=UPI001CA67471|nr:alpha/beta fold hydrolase [Streptomyces sennicomposti]MBY8864507.1 alpha/beta fold hydrolase [Streptomyces sennicomposti]
MNPIGTRSASFRRPSSAADDEWFLGSDAPASLPTLVFFPHAGAGAAAYWRLAQSQRDIARILIVRLPGRESRADEQLFTDIRPLIRALAPVLRPRLGDDYVFYGHSMGALIAFETARLFSLAYAMPPRHLVVSAMEAPQDVPTTHARHLLSDAELWQLVADMGGVPPEIAADTSMRQMLLPTIRADFEVTDTYTFRAMPLLTCPISTYAGEDDPELPACAMEAWQANTTAAFEHTVLPGGHFFNLDGQSGFTQALRTRLTG